MEFDGIVDVVYLSAKNRLDYLTRSGDVFEKKAWISTALNVDRVSNWYFTIVGSSPSLLLPTNDGLYQFYYD